MAHIDEEDLLNVARQYSTVNRDSISKMYLFLREHNLDQILVKFVCDLEGEIIDLASDNSDHEERISDLESLKEEYADLKKRYDLMIFNGANDNYTTGEGTLNLF